MVVREYAARPLGSLPAQLAKMACLVVLSLMMLYLMGGCSTSHEDSNSSSAAETVNSSAVDATDTGSYATDGIAISAIGSYEGAFALTGDGEYFDYINEATEDMLVEYVNGVDVEDFYMCSGEATSIDRSTGESLILAGTAPYNDTVALRACTENGYWQGPDLTSSILDYEEIDGVETDSLKNAEGYIDSAARDSFLSQYGIEYRGLLDKNAPGPGQGLNANDVNLGMFCSSSPQTLSAGWYKNGTTWVDGRFSVVTPYYYMTMDELEVPVTKTKEGYFIIDIDSLSPGYYSMHSVSKEYIIEII